MFGLFARISNEEVEAAVRAALERYETTGDLRRAVESLSVFAETSSLGNSKRARMAEHVAEFFIEGGVSDRAAAGYGEAFRLFIDDRVDVVRLHWPAFEAGVEGAIRHLSRWEEAEATAAAFAVAREYQRKPHLRSAIRDSYALGWSICGEAELARAQAERLDRHAAPLD